jgi:glyoxylase-like metal-dependent hydrolase (beta-lactamase superfamily II)
MRETARSSGKEPEVMNPGFQVRTIESMPFAENTYVLWRPERTECLVIDPGLEPDLILEVLRDENLSVAAILNTHGHVDHIGGNAELKAHFPEAPLLIGAGDLEMLSDPVKNLSALGGVRIVSPPADRTVAEGETLELAGLTFEVREIPGHSPGHVVFLCRDSSPWSVFGGDVLFRGGVGRCDFPGGSGVQLLTGIRRKLFDLPADTVVYPGHGPVTTIGHESKTNPFLT